MNDDLTRDIPKDKIQTSSNPYGTRRKPRRPYSELLSPQESKISTSDSLVASKKSCNGKQNLDNHRDSAENNPKRKTRNPQHKFRVTEENGYKSWTYSVDKDVWVKANDCIYLVCEPPSEPYYIGRIMEFTKLQQDSAGIDAVRINWFYRPRDMQHHSRDSRLLFATMHSDVSPLTSIRGKCEVVHRSQCLNLDVFRTQPDCFYYEKLFDKFMRRQYEVIPVDCVVNVPEHVKRVLLLRWKFVVVETNRIKELAMEHRACRHCGEWCASKDSVRCAICHADFHMFCVDPPLPRKPSRGFVWSCTPCSRAEAKRLEEAHSPDIDDRPNPVSNGNFSTDKPSVKEKSDTNEKTLEPVSASSAAAQNSAVAPCSAINSHPTARPELWPFRYLGVHCNINDAADHDDRIYPRAASRIGQRYQASVQDWPGRPIEYYERHKRPIKRTPKAIRGKRSDARVFLESSNLDKSSERLGTAEKYTSASSTGRPGEATNVSRIATDSDPSDFSTPLTEKPLWIQEKPINYLQRGDDSTVECLWKPTADMVDEDFEAYVDRISPIARKLDMEIQSPNFLDAALSVLHNSHYSLSKAQHSVEQFTREALGEPTFSQEEVSRFEDSVHKNGSDLAQVARDVGTQSVASCVRFYYRWKKTDAGAVIWANSEARKAKPEISIAASSSKAQASEQDQLGDSSDDSAYSNDKAVKVKRSFRCKYCETTSSPRWHRASVVVTKKGPIEALCKRCAILWRKYAVPWEKPEDVYKKLHDSTSKNRKRKFEEELLKELPEDGTKPGKREDFPEASKGNKKPKKVDKVKPKDLVSRETQPPCTVCLTRSENAQQRCRSCDMQVHASCYGISQDTPKDAEWLCDPCKNNIMPLASTDYACVLCYHDEHKNPSDSFGALKKTEGNNWVHIPCATWQANVTFAHAENFWPVQGIGSLSTLQWQATCYVCKGNRGVCISCHSCDKTFHVECALRSGYKLGFELLAVKSSQSRRESISLVRIGIENGRLMPVLYCPEHEIEHVSFYSLGHSIPQTQETAMSLYIKNYKLTDTGTARNLHGGYVRQAPAFDSSALALRLCETHPANSNVTNPKDLEDPTSERCDQCQIEYSPRFYRLNLTMDTNTVSDIEQVLCHQCYWLRSHST